MKKYSTLILALTLSLALSSCAARAPAQITATTLPVYQFTAALTDGTPLTVSQLVTESVSCLHDYTLTVDQMRAIEGAQVVVTSGAGLESFMDEPLQSADDVIDASEGIQLLEGHEHTHNDENTDDGHSHEEDPHIWLSPKNAALMARNICNGLSNAYPEYADRFELNLQKLMQQLEALDQYGVQQLQDLSCRDLITFHDGFAYLADAYDLHILEAIEEDAGSEAPASELTHLIELVREYQLPAIFTEVNGSASAASILSAETGVPSYPLDMAMSGGDYFASMYHNIDTLKEALK